jgi:hypothetical protein
VSGLKLMLPENAVRKDTKEYEEVIIPKNDPAPLQIGNNRVPISDMDEVTYNVYVRCFGPSNRYVITIRSFPQVTWCLVHTLSSQNLPMLKGIDVDYKCRFDTECTKHLV